MEAELQEHVAFHLTGKRPAAGLDAVDDFDLRPALLARYRSLTQLRYDFPLVLVRETAADRSCVQSLSAIFDGVAHAIAHEDDTDRVTNHLLRLEQQIRTAVAAGANGWLSALWERAAKQMALHGDDKLKDSLARARAALKADGEVVDCGKALPVNVLRHTWNAVQEQKARRFRADINRLILKLSDILRADFVQSKAGRSAASLKASVGNAHEEEFDFDAMSRMLGKTAPRNALPEARRRRIEELLKVLKAQRFYSGIEGAPAGTQAYPFVFDNCGTALAAWRERLPKAIELAKAIAIAALEIDAQYNEARHDLLFAGFGADGLEIRDTARLPDYLVCLGAAQLAGAESDKLMEIMSAGLPMKLLVQTDDILDDAPLGGDAHLAFGLRSKQLANMAIGLNEVYVLQAAASHLYQFRDRILKGLNFAGPALFSVFSGASGKSRDLPPYLIAAAAMESRAFPAFTFDPSAGANWAARFYLDANSQVESDWPVQRFEYEDENQQRVAEDVAFTVIDFVAADRRYARHFACVPRAQWSKNLVPANDCLGRERQGIPDQIPCVMMVDRQNVLQKVIVDDKLVRAAQRSRAAWHSLQELGGIHNSHAERLLAKERKVWEEREQEEAAAHAPQAQSAAAAAPVAAAAAVETAPAVAEEPARSPDEAYIETERCTTCNECTTINNKMFAYNESKQAVIADLGAGTFQQLVEAAESCPVAIIHPGKPRNASEPGLDDLLKRAESFS
jgi:ferredoxin